MPDTFISLRTARMVPSLPEVSMPCRTISSASVPAAYNNSSSSPSSFTSASSSTLPACLEMSPSLCVSTAARSTGWLPSQRSAYPMLPILSPITICQLAVRAAPQQINSDDQISGEGDALDGEQTVLDSQPARVATNRGVGANHAVAGHNYRDRVSAEGIANRARRTRLA